MIIHSRMHAPAQAPGAPTEGEAPARSATRPVRDGVVHLKISGMHCAACVGRVEQALAAVPGVADASVNLATERALVRLAEPVLDERLSAAVRDAGYGARPVASPARSVIETVVPPRRPSGGVRVSGAYAIDC